MAVAYLEEKRYLRVQLSGTWNIDEFPSHVASMAKECQERKQSPLLIDFTFLKWDRVSTLERYRMGQTAELLDGKAARVSVLARPDQIDPGRFAEQVARNRGANVKVFIDPEKAQRWLLEPEQKQER